jgi:serine protease
MKRIISLGVLALGLSACPSNPTPNPPPPNQTGSISGTVGFPVGINGVQSPEFIPGEVIVKFKSGVRSAARLNLNDINFVQNASLGLRSAYLYRSSASINPQATLEMVQKLQARSDVEYAQPNYIQRVAKTPQDGLFSYQWDAPAINLPQAWDVVDGTQGPAVVVAVIDTGILWAGDTSSVTHPDLIGKVLSGVDMISDPRRSGDGDGRDTDAYDVGDAPSGGQSSYHGSHVAGTVAASTNNQTIGVAGVSWGAKILPVRVLGQGGGSTQDILDGVLWAAGVDVPGLPSNPNPASIINMSLGGNFPCSQSPAYQDVLNQVRNKGVIVVVAAGNENDNTANHSPSSCAGVITVGATDFPGARAPYSNFGTRIDVMAPGGDMGVDANNDTKPDGILSLAKNDATGELAYKFSNGTSQATPHVAGVLALMKALRPSLTPDQALNILKDTSKARSGAQCQGRNGGTQTATDCGAGLIDALAAVNATNTASNGNPDLSLKLSQGGLTIKPGANANLTLEINCTGGLTGTVDLQVSGDPAGVNISATAAACGSSVTINIAVDGSVASKTYPLLFYGTSGSLERNVAFSLTVQTTTPSVQNTFVGAFYVTSTKDLDETKSNGVILSQTTSSATFKIEGLETGNYLVIAWKDVNGDKTVNAGDLVAVEPNLVNPSKAGLNLKLEPFSSTNSASASTGAWTSLEAAYKKLH